MAFLRFSRDKRGYENFYLVETSTNRRGKTRARILYWFRTPPGVKVGREPFDPEVRRTLEQQNPNIVFDWRKISETPIPSADAEKWRERRRLERAEKARRRTVGSSEPDDDDSLEDGGAGDQMGSPDEDGPVDSAELPTGSAAADGGEAEPESDPSSAGVHAPEAVVAGPAPPADVIAPPSDSSSSASPASPLPGARSGRRRRRRRRGGRRLEAGPAVVTGHPAPERADATATATNAPGSNESFDDDENGESAGPDDSSEV